MTSLDSPIGLPLTLELLYSNPQLRFRPAGPTLPPWQGFSISIGQPPIHLSGLRYYGFNLSSGVGPRNIARTAPCPEE